MPRPYYPWLGIMRRMKIAVGMMFQETATFSQLATGRAAFEALAWHEGSAFLKQVPESVEIGRRIADHCERRGVIVRPLGHLNVISPPLILTCDQIDTVVGVLREAILATAEGMVPPAVSATSVKR